MLRRRLADASDGRSVELTISALLSLLSLVLAAGSLISFWTFKSTVPMTLCSSLKVNRVKLRTKPAVYQFTLFFCQTVLYLLILLQLVFESSGISSDTSCRASGALIYFLTTASSLTVMLISYNTKSMLFADSDSFEIYSSNWREILGIFLVSALTFLPFITASYDEYRGNVPFFCSFKEETLDGTLWSIFGFYMFEILSALVMLVLYFSILRGSSDVDIRVSVLLMYPLVSVVAALAEALWLYVGQAGSTPWLQYLAFDLWLLQGVFFSLIFYKQRKAIESFEIWYMSLYHNDMPSGHDDFDASCQASSQSGQSLNVPAILGEIENGSNNNRKSLNIAEHESISPTSLSPTSAIGGRAENSGSSQSPFELIRARAESGRSLSSGSYAIGTSIKINYDSDSSGARSQRHLDSDDPANVNTSGAVSKNENRHRSKPNRQRLNSFKQVYLENVEEDTVSKFVVGLRLHRSASNAGISGPTSPATISPRRGHSNHNSAHLSSATSSPVEKGSTDIENSHNLRSPLL